MRKKTVALKAASVMVLAFYAATAAHADDHEDHSRYHDAHEHGVAQLNIAQEGNTLHLELETPAMNVVGFEHMPSNEQQIAAVNSAVMQLKLGDQLFLFPAAARCLLLQAEVSSGLLEHAVEHKDEHEDKHGHEDEHEGEEASEKHADFDVSYQFRCEQPEQLNTLTAAWFTHFPATEELAVQMITDRGQKSFHLTPSSSSHDF
ncbi:MAG: DUF2796 domain-containing protein [Gammaproteobacteria bacterium]|nr:DUF2796 domain-containing protein [Gammaproteobacteria bacterium]